MIFVTHRKRLVESEAQTRQPAFPAPRPNPASLDLSRAFLARRRPALDREASDQAAREADRGMELAMAAHRVKTRFTEFWVR